MNISHIVVLLIRLFAVWLAVHVLQNIAYSIPLLSDDLMTNFSGYVSASFFLFVSYFLVALLLWFFPHTAAEKLTGLKASAHQGTPALNADQFSGIAYGVVGVY